jgi:hypothetical protein
VATEFNVASGDTFTLCDYDEGGVAGVIGIGFDFYLSGKPCYELKLNIFRGKITCKSVSGLSVFVTTFSV